MPDFRKPVRKYGPQEQYGAPPKDYSQGANNFQAPLPDGPDGVDELARLGAEMVQPEADRRLLENPKTLADRIKAKSLGAHLAAKSPNAIAPGGAQYHRTNPGSSNWRDTLTPDEAWIIQRESGFNPEAWNNTVVYDRGKRLGNAHGLGQIVSDIPRDQRSTDPNEQLAAFRTYVQGRYGSAANAVNFWKANGWY